MRQWSERQGSSEHEKKEKPRTKLRREMRSSITGIGGRDGNEDDYGRERVGGREDGGSGGRREGGKEEIVTGVGGYGLGWNWRRRLRQSAPTPSLGTLSPRWRPVASVA